MTQDNISVLLIEDEEVWARTMQKNLADFGFEVTAVASTVVEALPALNAMDYDIVLLDIHLNGVNSGIELAKLLHTHYHKPFIFVTSSLNSHSLQEAITAKPSAYLIKPINPASLFVTIHSAINNFQQEQPAGATVENNYDSFFIKQGNKYKKIDWKDVICLISEKNYTRVFTSRDNSEYLIRSSLQKAMQYIIPASLRSRFAQVNRAEIVQLSYVEELAGDVLKAGNKTFYITEAYHKDLKKSLNIIS